MFKTYSSSIPVLFLVVLIGFCSCANKSYSIKEFQRSKTEVILTGRVVDSKSGINLPGVLIRNVTDSSSAYTNKDGWYEMKLNTTNLRIKAIYVGYYNVISKRLKLNPGDSIVVNFRIGEDSRPLID